MCSIDITPDKEVKMRMKGLLLFTVLIASTIAFGQSVRKDVIVSPEWLAGHPDVVVLDVSNGDAFLKGHIPGARLIELQSLVTDRDGTPNELPSVAALESLFSAAGVGDRSRIVVYSRDPLYAARAWFTLDYLGQGQRTSYLDGGFARWMDEARPVATEITPVEPTPFHSSVHAEAVTSLNAMRVLVRLRKELASDLALIDARGAEQFCGKEAGAGVDRAGHIPGAVNVTWTENLIAGAIPRLLPERELREVYTMAGVSPRSTNVVYCRTGMQASLTYMVLKYLGYGATLYDGSFIEWNIQPDAPVAMIGERAITTSPVGR
jgi:thiosulfate/3-mercaptopyruvate sulfurtransferase